MVLYRSVFMCMSAILWFITVCYAQASGVSIGQENNAKPVEQQQIKRGCECHKLATEIKTLSKDVDSLKGSVKRLGEHIRYCSDQLIKFQNNTNILDKKPIEPFKENTTINTPINVGNTQNDQPTNQQQMPLLSQQNIPFYQQPVYIPTVAPTKYQQQNEELHATVRNLSEQVQSLYNLFSNGSTRQSQSNKYPLTGIMHELRTNDTIDNIARRYETNPEYIKQANHIKDTTGLQDGDLLFIPIDSTR